MPGAQFGDDMPGAEQMARSYLQGETDTKGQPVTAALVQDQLRKELANPNAQDIVERGSGLVDFGDGSYTGTGTGGAQTGGTDEDKDLSSQTDLAALSPMQPGDPDAEAALQAMYGADFPLLETNPDDGDWAKWAVGLWGKHREGNAQRLHLVERNRLMRHNVHWVSAQGLGPWREPPKPRDATRAVDNMITPALDQRLQIISEQRPGFRAKPTGHDQRSMKKAQAQQKLLEYQFDSQEMNKIIREASYWAGTDGVSFLHQFWDADAGPWDEVMVPSVEEDGTTTFAQQFKPLGEAKSQVLRIEQVRVSADASATQRPAYIVIRQVISTAQAVREYGPDVLETANDDAAGSTRETQGDSLPSFRVGGFSSVPDSLLKDQPKIDRYTVYCDKSEYLPQGLMLVVVGMKLVVPPMPLLFGVVPVVRVTDGSTDPNYFPEAIMEGWIDSQMRINALKSRWIDSVRVNSGGRFLGRENAIVGETLVGGLTSVISVRGAGPISDAVQPVQGFSVGNDVKELLEIEKKAFEDRSGWNDASRGSNEGDQSGRAILAIREQLERIFSPPVNAVAEAMVEWGKVTIAICRWGYNEPRNIAVMGRGRPDLAQAITSDDLDGVANVTIDPETLMPMPRALRLFLLDSYLQKGAISMQEYMRRQPFAFTDDLDSPDTDQNARAQRVVQALRQTANPNALPVLWQDNEAIHQDVLERELILVDDPEDVPPQVRQAAIQRWQLLAQQAAQKQAPPRDPNQIAFQKFVDDTKNKVLIAAEALVAKEVQMADGMAPPPGAQMGAQGAPPSAPRPPMPGAPGAPGAPQQQQHHMTPEAAHSQLRPQEQPNQSTNPSIAAGTTPMMLSSDGGNNPQAAIPGLGSAAPQQ